MKPSRTVFAVLAALAVAAAPARAQDSTPQENIDAYLNQLVICPGTRLPGAAMVIVRDGASGPEVVYSGTHGVRKAGDSDDPVTTDTIFNLGTATSMLNALVLGTLKDDGLLDWGDRVTEHLPELQGWLDSTGRGDLTLADLLTHQGNWEPNDAVAAFDVDTNSRSIGEFARESFPHFEPLRSFRKRFSLFSFGATLTAAVAEEVTGESWDDLFQDRIVAPLGIEDLYTSSAWVLANRPAEYTFLHGLEISGSITTFPRDLNTRYDGPARPHSGALLDLEAAEDLLLGMAAGFPGVLEPETWEEISSHRVRSLFRFGLEVGTPFSLNLDNRSYGAFVGRYEGRKMFLVLGDGLGVSTVLAGFPDDGLYMAFFTNQWGLSSTSSLFLMLYARDELIGRDSFFSPALTCNLSSAITLLPPIYESLTPVTGAPDAWFGTYTHPLYGSVTLSRTAAGEAEISLGAVRGLVREPDGGTGYQWFLESGFVEPLRIEVRFPAEGGRLLLELLELEGGQDPFVEFIKDGGSP